MTTSPRKPAPATAQGTNRDFAAVAGLFIANGLAVGVLGGSLPGLRAHLSLSPATSSACSWRRPSVAVFSMNLSGALSDRHGARLPALVGGAVMAGGAVLMGLAPDYRVLILGAAVFGLGNGAMDVAMNALGVSVEQARRRPVMSRLHASLLDRQLRGRAAGRGVRLAARGRGATVAVVDQRAAARRTPRCAGRHHAASRRGASASG